MFSRQCLFPAGVDDKKRIISALFHEELVTFSYDDLVYCDYSSKSNIVPYGMKCEKHEETKL